MATRKHSGPASAPVLDDPPARTQEPILLPFDLVREARAINYVAQWVLKARDAVDRVRFYEFYGSEEMQAAAKAMYIDRPCWDIHHMEESLGELLERQRDLIDAFEAAGEAASGPDSDD